MDSIRLIEIRGGHRQVGQGIGEEMRLHIQSRLARLGEGLPRGKTVQAAFAHSHLYLQATQGVYPEYVDELQGVAEGAGVPFEEVFLAVCEEIWEEAAWAGKGCTDMAARGRATHNGHTLLAHTNDLPPETEAELVILKVQAGAEPEFLGVSVAGLGYSAGFNTAGIGLSGNQVDNNDIRVGVPRLLVVRRILAARRLGEALSTCLLPVRASSYNNIVADAYGEVFSMEGSATDMEPIYIQEDFLAHANHFHSPRMRRYEADPGATGDSLARHYRAERLLRQNYGRHSPELFQQLLADHANFPASICKHEGEVVTVFSMIMDIEERRVWIGKGRPCQSQYQEYQLEPDIRDQDKY